MVSLIKISYKKFLSNITEFSLFLFVCLWNNGQFNHVASLERDGDSSNETDDKAIIQI